ncbi:MAG: hypothetical protein ABW217_01735 [Polyangiaceae bacterium]
MVWALGAPALAAEGEASASGAAAPAEVEGRWSFGVGAGFSLGLDNREEGESDLVVISSLAFGELTCTTMYQLTPKVALGFDAGWGSDLGSRGFASSDGEALAKDTSIWQVALSGRFQPEPRRGWYLGGEGGAVAIADSIGDDSVTQWAPLVAASAGHELRLGSSFALALELRAAHAWFSEDGRTLVLRDSVGASSTRYEYGSTTWLGLSLLGRFLL